LSGVDRKVLAFLKNNPGATPREVADALGLPYNVVRHALLRLREAGYVVRSPRGGYLVRVGFPALDDAEVARGGSNDSRPDASVAELVGVIEELRSIVMELKARVDRLEQEVNLLKKGIPTHKVRQRKDRKTPDPLLSTLSSKGLVTLSEARKLASKPIEAYINEGVAIPIGNYLVNPEFLDKFKKKFPLSVGEVEKMSPEERGLLDSLIKEGLVYLHAGREYRIIS